MPKSDCGVQLGLSSLLHTHTHTVLSLSHTLVVSLCVSLSLDLSRYVFPRFHSIPLFSRLVTPGQCQRLKTIVLAVTVSSPVEWSVLQPLDCKHAAHSRVTASHPHCRTSPLSLRRRGQSGKFHALILYVGKLTRNYGLSTPTQVSAVVLSLHVIHICE